MTAGASAESGEAESLSSGIDTIVSALDSAALESALYGSKIPHFAFCIPNWCARK